VQLPSRVPATGSLTGTADAPTAPSALGTVNKQQLAEALGVTTTTLRLLVRDGRLPQPIRISRNTLIWRISDLQEVFARLSAGGAP
jgi:predicted DNA-binding transcriptional regulator AlpA